MNALCGSPGIFDLRPWYESSLQAVAGEPALREVLLVIMADCELRPRYIAVEINISVREVANRLKRLRRCALKLAKQEVRQSH